MNKWVLGVVVALLAVAMIRRRGGESVTTDLDESSLTEADIDRLITSGRKIDAIKLYRRLHNAGLKEAKDAIDTRARQLSGSSG